MPPRTLILAALRKADHLAVLEAVLNQGPLRTNEVSALTGITQANVSKALKALERAGFVSNGGRERQPYSASRPRETRWLLMSAALIEHAHTGNSAALDDAAALRRRDMERGASDDARLGAPHSRWL